MNIEEILKSAQKSVTEERKEVFEYLASHHLVSSAQIVEHFPSIGRASIFRILKLFSDIGVVRRVSLDEKQDLYEIVDENNHHEHMKCTQCGKIMNFESKDICQMIVNQAKKLGFEVKEHAINIKGCCQNCLALKK